MKNTFCLLTFLIILSLSAAGCLETRDAWPAEVSGPVLAEYGWSNTGDVVKQSQVQEIAGNPVKINMAIMSYRDDALANDIAGQASEISGNDIEDISGMSELTSRLITIRLVLPGGISIPQAIVNTFINSQVDMIASQNNISDFHNTGKKSITLANGKTADLNIFKGSIVEDFGRMDMKGMVASWSDSGSTIIVFAVMSASDILVEPDSKIKIDGEKNSGVVTELIRNVN